MHDRRLRLYGTPGEAETRRPGRKGEPTLCHPDRPMKAKGLCNACYQRSLDKKNRKANLRHFYRLSLEDEARMLAEQGGGCAVCGQLFTGTPRVDHDHSCCPGQRSCGECVRGLLCNACNHAEGLLSSDPDRALALAAYLIRTRRVEAEA